MDRTSAARLRETLQSELTLKVDKFTTIVLPSITETDLITALSKIQSTTKYEEKVRNIAAFLVNDNKQCFKTRQRLSCKHCEFMLDYKHSKWVKLMPKTLLRWGLLPNDLGEHEFDRYNAVEALFTQRLEHIAQLAFVLSEDVIKRGRFRNYDNRCMLVTELGEEFGDLARKGNKKTEPEEELFAPVALIEFDRRLKKIGGKMGQMSTLIIKGGTSFTSPAEMLARLVEIKDNEVYKEDIELFSEAIADKKLELSELVEELQLSMAEKLEGIIKDLQRLRLSCPKEHVELIDAACKRLQSQFNELAYISEPDEAMAEFAVALTKDVMLSKRFQGDEDDRQACVDYYLRVEVKDLSKEAEWNVERKEGKKREISE